MQHLFFPDERFVGRFDAVEKVVSMKPPLPNEKGNLIVTSYRVIFEPINKEKSVSFVEWTKLINLKYNPKTNQIFLETKDQMKHLFCLWNINNMEDFKKMSSSFYDKEKNVALGTSMSKDRFECMPLTKTRQTSSNVKDLLQGKSQAAAWDSLYVDELENEKRVSEIMIRLEGAGASSTSGKSKVYAVNDRVECNFRGRGKWYSGSITRDYGNKSYDIAYDEVGRIEIPPEEKRKVIFSVYPDLEVSYRKHVDAGSMDDDFVQHSNTASTASKDESERLKRQAAQVPLSFNVFNSASEFDRSKFTSHPINNNNLEFSGNYNRTAKDELHKRYEEKKGLSSGWVPLNRLSQIYSVNSTAADQKANEAADESELGMLENKRGPGTTTLILSAPASKRAHVAHAGSADSSAGGNSPQAFGVATGLIRPDASTQYSAMGFVELCETLKTSAPSSQKWKELMVSSSENSGINSTLAAGGADSADAHYAELLKILDKEKYYATLAIFWDKVSEGQVDLQNKKSMEDVLAKLSSIEQAIREFQKSQYEQLKSKIDIVFTRILEPITQARKVWQCIKRMSLME